jgi:hypothetical protein
MVGDDSAKLCQKILARADRMPLENIPGFKIPEKVARLEKQKAKVIARNPCKRTVGCLKGTVCEVMGIYIPVFVRTPLTLFHLK